ncbi:MAG: hypothetical protein IJT60_06375 [Clostridia bacterium]|nr:hypothetical protein [Clostridia bacterium]
MKRKLIIFLLLAAMLLTVLASCGSSSQTDETESSKGTGKTPDEPGQETTGEDETQKQDYPFGVPEELDFNEADFIILTCPGENETTAFYWTQFDSHMINGDQLNDQIYYRNLAIEEDLNIHLVIDTSGNLVNTDAFSTRVLGGGSDAFQLGVWIDRFALNMVMNGYVQPIEALTKEAGYYVDLDAPWWYQTVNQELTVDHHLYFAGGYFNVDLFGGMQIVLFNQAIVEDKHLDNPYELYDLGLWTMDTMVQMEATAATDLDGDEEMTENDLWGLAYNGSHWNNNFIVVNKQNYIAKDENDLPYLNALGNEELYDILECLLEDVLDKSYAFNMGNAKLYNTGHIYENNVRMFADSKALFAGTCATYMGNLRNATFDYGTVPFPTYHPLEPGDQYRSYNTGVVAHFVPSSSTQDQLVSAVLEEMAYYSYVDVIPAFVDEVLELKNVRDEKSSEILHALNQNLHLELGQTYWYDVVCGSTAHEIITKGMGVYVSAFTSAQSKIEAALDRTIEAFEKLDN